MTRCQDKIPDTEVLKRAGMQTTQTSTENLSWGSALNVARRNAIASLKDFNIPPESREHTAHDGRKRRCLTRKETDERESTTLNRSAKNAKPEPRDHNQSCHFQN